MAITPIISQLKPVAGTLTLINTTTIISQLDEFVACNQGSSDDYIRFLINPNTAACCIEDNQYIFYDVKVKAHSTLAGKFDDWLPKGTIMKVYSLNGDVSFTIFTHTM